MSPIPAKVRLFHITAISNLPAILAGGALLAKTVLTAQQHAYTNIAHGHIQERRAAKKVTLPPHGTLHDYVPFYFAPRSPMLMAINTGQVQGCQTGQADIVHLVTSPEKVVETGRPFVFYDLHAAMDYSTPYNDLTDLDKIDWPLITETPHIPGGGAYCKYFHSVPQHERWHRRKEVRQAEFLVHQQLPLSALLGVATQNEQKREEVVALLEAAGLGELKVVVKLGWYF